MALHPSTTFPVVADPCFSCWASTAWKVTKCVAAIGVFVGTNYFLVTKLKKFGGATKLAKALVAANSTALRMKVMMAAFGEVLGISTVVNNCK